MQPSQLTVSSFSSYPEIARNEAVSNLPLLREFPLPLLASVLRELSRFDLLFPAEQDTIAGQLRTLTALNGQERIRVFSQFAALSVPSSLSEMDWVNAPKHFLEALTTHLWASHQIDAFHVAAFAYAATVVGSTQEVSPPLPRVSVVMLAPDLERTGYPLFRKLRPHGVFFEEVNTESGYAEIAAWLARRGAQLPAPLTHFYVDGSDPLIASRSPLEVLSWTGIAPVRQELLARMRRMTRTPGTGPEMARTEMAGLSPADFGLHRVGKDSIMDHFALSVLTEGSGSQIFSTTFAQWTARELLRRAQPVTLVVRFCPRQQLQPMNEMLSGTSASGAPDLAGSFVDGDMGAYYTWINQQRLPGASSSGFLALSESRRQAVAIGPGLARNTTSPNPIAIGKLLSLLC